MDLGHYPIFINKNYLSCFVKGIYAYVENYYTFSLIIDLLPNYCLVDTMFNGTQHLCIYKG